MMNHDLNLLDGYHKTLFIDFFWKMIKLKNDFKQWHLYSITELFKNINLSDERVKDVYYNILDTATSENSKSRMLQNIALDNIIDLVNLSEVTTMKNAVNFLKQHDSTLVHMANIIIKYERKFFAEIKEFYRVV